MFVNYIRVPFISAFDIDNYIEMLSLGIIPSGEYIEGRVAEDNFTKYLTGFRSFFSGSGYWLTSGSSYPMTQSLLANLVGYNSGQYKNSSLDKTLLYRGFNPVNVTGNVYIFSFYQDDSFINYPTGFYTSLTGSIYQSAYNSYTGYQTGTLYLLSFYQNDPFTEYETGLYSQLTGSYYKNSYNYNYSYKTGITYNYSNEITGGTYGGSSGSFSNNYFWRITQSLNVSPSNGYIGNGYGTTTGAWADYLPYSITYTGDASGPFGLKDFTVEFWMKRSGWGASSDVMIGTNPTTGFSIARDSTTDKIKLYVKNNSLLSSSTISNNTWTHIAATRQDSGMMLYFNGVLDSSTNGVTGSLASNYILVVGSAGSLNGGTYTTPFVGSIDEVRIWNYARTQSEIYSNMNSQIISAPGLITYLTFDNS